MPSFFQHLVTSIKSGHNDKRIFVATGNQVHVGWITSPSIAYLQLLNRFAIWKSLRLKRDVESLPLPCSLQNLISLLFTQTIRVMPTKSLVRATTPSK